MLVQSASVCWAWLHMTDDYSLWSSQYENRWGRLDDAAVIFATSKISNSVTSPSLTNQYNMNNLIKQCYIEQYRAAVAKSKCSKHTNKYMKQVYPYSLSQQLLSCVVDSSDMVMYNFR